MNNELKENNKINNVYIRKYIFFIYITLIIIGYADDMYSVNKNSVSALKLLTNYRLLGNNIIDPYYDHCSDRNYHSIPPLENLEFEEANKSQLLYALLICDEKHLNNNIVPHRKYSQIEKAMIGSVYWKIGNKNIAIEWWRTTGIEKYFINKSIKNFGEGQKDLAYQYANLALLINPNNSVALTYSAASAMDLMLFDDDILTKLEKAIKIDPNNSFAYWELAMFYIYSPNIRDISKGSKYISEACRLGWNIYNCNYHLSYVNFLLKNYDLAWKYITEAEKILDKKNPELFLLKSRIAINGSNLGEAKKALKQLKEIYPENYTYILIIARELLNNGYEDQAAMVCYYVRTNCNYCDKSMYIGLEKIPICVP